ncbi:MAG: hypothetical protein IPG04_31235 [Polyangiaceae bacterium]|nr:hypothetical protein [Polyangiaceae bacterium]
MANGRPARIEEARRLLQQGAVHPRGCSELVSLALGIEWTNANALMGDFPTLVGDNGNYEGLMPGDVVGWKRVGGSGHVAIYVGDPARRFIDVRAPGNRPRQLNSYGPQKIYKSDRY